MRLVRPVLGLMIATLFSTGTANAQEPNRGDKVPGSKAGTVANPSDEQLKQVLQEATRAIQALGEEAGNPGEVTFRAFALKMTEDALPRALLAIGTAHSKLGDPSAARATWQEAANAASVMGDKNDKADVLQSIGLAQAECGDRPDALAMLRQAAQAASTIRDDPMMPAAMRRFQGDALEKKASAMRRIATAQAKAGDQLAAKKTFEQAIQAANGIKDSAPKASAMIAIAEARAEANDADGGRATRQHAIEFAMGLGDEQQKGKAVEAILRKQVESGAIDEALKTATDRLAGDLRAFALWAIADAIVGREHVVPSHVVQQALQAAAPADYDRFSKKVKVLARIAEAQARAEDSDGALHTVDLLSDNDPVRAGQARKAKLTVLLGISQAHAKAGKRDAAREALNVALEILAPFMAEDGGAVFSLDDIAQAQAKAGDLDGAFETVKAIRDGLPRATALARIAMTQAEAGEKEAARKTLEKAEEATKDIPKDMLWTDGPEGMDFRPQAWRIIATAHARAGDLPGILRSMKAISGPDSIVGGFEKTNAAEAIAPILAKAGDVENALKVVDSIGSEDPYFESKKAPILATIAGHQAEAGDPQGALAWALKLNSPNGKALALRGIADGIARRADRRDGRHDGPAEAPPKPADTKDNSNARAKPEPDEPELAITPNTVRIESLDRPGAGDWIVLPAFSELGSPTFSKDGEWVAFDAYKMGYNNSPSECYIARRDGTSLRRLAIGATPRWSPDGQQLLFMRDEANDPRHEPGIFLINRDGTGERRIGDGRWPDWSPDGTSIVFSIGGQPGTGLRPGARVSLSRLDGSDRRDITAGDCPSWSPDGKQIACCFKEPDGPPLIRVFDLKTKGSITVGIGWFRANWTPNSKALVANGIVGREVHQAMVKYPVQPSATAEPLFPEAQDPTSPFCSSDGKFVVFIAKRPQSKSAP